MANRHVLTLVLLVLAIVITIFGSFLGFLAYSKEPYVTLQEVTYRYKKVSMFSGYYYLKPNRIYDNCTISIGSELPMYLNLVEGINLSYSYRVEEAEALGDVELNVFLKHPDGWSKKYIEKKLNFENYTGISLYIDLNNASQYMESLCRELGQKLSFFDVVVDVHANHSVKVGTLVVLDTNSHRISFAIDIARNRIDVDGALAYEVPEEQKKNLSIPQKLFGLDVGTVRSISTLITSVGVITSGALLVFRSRTSSRTFVNVIDSKYGNIIISAEDPPLLRNDRIVQVSGIEDLVKVARLLEKPIIKYIDNDNCTTLYIVATSDYTYVFKVNHSHETQ
ncbi:MAG: hypothetical protein DRO13_04575 [Thermoprotei archaeon]|nr:MAG: hypothetical protein DRO13_04575 [Thermoprotei archaeon]